MLHKHTIDLDEMLEWIEIKRSAMIPYAASTRENKSLCFRLSGGYVVHHNGAVVYWGTDGRTAVETYNAISSN